MSLFISRFIDKLGAMTPTPMQNNLGWGLGGDGSGIAGRYDYVAGGTVSDFGGGGGQHDGFGYQHNAP